LIAINNFSLLSEKFFPKRETLIEIKKDEENKIREILEQRKIEYLVHFTRIENLPSILEHGLIPVSIQGKRKIVSIHNDEQRIDAKLDCTSCSVGFPNYKLFHFFRQYKYQGSKWVIIKLKTDVLFSSDNISYFCNTNAARVLPRISNVKELCNSVCFENMFCDKITIKEKIIKRSELLISDHFTTDPQCLKLVDHIKICSIYILKMQKEMKGLNHQENLNISTITILFGNWSQRQCFMIGFTFSHCIEIKIYRKKFLIMMRLPILSLIKKSQ
jgi:hypothetical protein